MYMVQDSLSSVSSRVNSSVKGKKNEKVWAFSFIQKEKVSKQTAEKTTKLYYLLLETDFSSMSETKTEKELFRLVFDQIFEK